MKTQLNTLLNRVDTRLAACAAAAGASLAAVPATQADIVWSGPVSINIPSTTAGIYLNVATGVFNASPGLVPGWDINPYSATSLTMFNPSVPAGGVYVVNAPGGTSATLPDNLPFLAYLIDATSGYGSGAVETTGPTAINLNSSNNIFGFRFQNEAMGNQIQYGWFRVSLAGTSGAQPRMIVEYAYENTGAGIMAGDIPEPTTLGLLGLAAMGALGVRAWRGRKVA